MSGPRSCIYTWNAMNSTKVNIKDFIINHKHYLDQQEIFNKNYIFTNFNYWEYLTHVLWVSGQLLSAIVAVSLAGLVRLVRLVSWVDLAS